MSFTRAIFNTINIQLVTNWILHYIKNSCTNNTFTIYPLLFTLHPFILSAQPGYWPFVSNSFGEQFIWNRKCYEQTSIQQLVCRHFFLIISFSNHFQIDAFTHTWKTFYTVLMIKLVLLDYKFGQLLMRFSGIIKSMEHILSGKSIKNLLKIIATFSTG